MQLMTALSLDHVISENDTKWTKPQKLSVKYDKNMMTKPNYRSLSLDKMKMEETEALHVTENVLLEWRSL